MGNACCGGIEHRKAGVVVANDNDDENDDDHPSDDVEYNAAAEKREKLIK